MHILAIVSRDLEKGSTKFRIAQYLDYLGQRGAEVEFVRRDEIDKTTIERAHRADVLFNQKCLIRTSIARKLIAANRRVIFDFDDAIYTRPGKPFSWVTQLEVNRRFHIWLKTPQWLQLRMNILLVMPDAIHRLSKWFQWHLTCQIGNLGLDNLLNLSLSAGLEHQSTACWSDLMRTFRFFWIDTLQLD